MTATTAAHWRGADQARRTDWIHELSPAEIEELVSVTRGLVAAGVPVERITPADAPLPLLAPALSEWARQLDDGRGFVLVRGVPVAELGPVAAAVAFMALGVHLGAPVAQNNDGDLLGHVRDDGSDPDDPTVRRYRTRLEQPFHVDGSDVVGLLCLHPARSGGLSKIVSSVTVLTEVEARRPDLVPLLREPWYFDRYGQQGPGERPWFSMPILTDRTGRFQFVYLRWYIDKAQAHADVPRLTPDQVELLDLIDAIADDPAIRLDMDFRPGDIQFVANRMVLHARTGYDDHDEPERRRHLLRLWLDRRRSA